MPPIRDEQSATRNLPYSIVKPAKTSAKKSVFAYDKKLMLALVLKQVNPDWDAIASAMNDKTKSKTYDTWRQGIYPALVAGRPWCNAAGGSWTTEEKIKLVMTVIKSIRIDWKEVNQIYPDRTKAQLYDVWRQNIVPKLKKGEAIV